MNGSVVGHLHKGKHNGLLLKSEDNDDVALTLADAIRMADTPNVRKILNNKHADILKSEMSLNIKMHLDWIGLERNSTRPPSNIIEELNSGDLESVKLILTPIHIAIIADQVAIVKEIFDCVLNQYNLHSSEEVNERYDYVLNQYSIGGNDEVEKDVCEILSQKTKVHFKADPKHYAYSDQILDGITAVHLAAIFSPQSLDYICKILTQEDIMDGIDFQSLLDEKDPHAGNTPLHMSARMADCCATW